MPTKVTQLTGMNVRALREMLTEEEKNDVTLTATTATFDMDAQTAVTLLNSLRQRASRLGTRGHPYQSLAAVRSKLERKRPTHS